MIECYDYEEIDKTMRYYGTSYVTESDFPFNFYLLYLPDDLSGNQAKRLVNLWMSNMPKGKWPNWVVSDQISVRSLRIRSLQIFKAETLALLNGQFFLFAFGWSNGLLSLSHAQNMFVYVYRWETMTSHV